MAKFSYLSLELPLFFQLHIQSKEYFRPLGVLNRSTQLRHSRVKCKYNTFFLGVVIGVTIVKTQIIIRILSHLSRSPLDINLPFSKVHLSKKSALVNKRTLYKTVVIFLYILASNSSCFFLRCIQDVNEEATVKRFYLSLILYKLLKEHTVWEVAAVFKVTRGFVQNLLTSASSFASCMVHFTGVSTRLNIKYTPERVSGSANRSQIHET